MSSRDGFSLLEVLLAILILGISLTVYFGAANQGLSLIGAARNYERGRSYLNQLELREPLALEDLEEGTLSGSLTLDGERVEWNREISLVGPEEDELYELRTEVRWGEEQSESTLIWVHKASAEREGWIETPVE